MPFVTSEQMLKKASREGYAVGAFNAENMEFIQAIVSAAEEMRSPVIIQTTPGSIRYAGLEEFVAMAKAIAEKATVDVCLHLDHGSDFELCRRGVEAGYRSVMIDGSKLPFAENIALAQKTVEAAHAAGIPVEAELGMLGGKEDDTVGTANVYTDPADAAEFVAKTGIDSLAVAVGTAHGVYKETPILDVPRVGKIRKVVSVPLVLHGASGLTDESIRACIAKGIAKVNFATELRIAFTSAVKQYLLHNDVIDPKKYLALGREAVADQVKARIAVCGSQNKN